ncbi:Tyrosine-protein phosphatase 69D [Armadillidium nasatum]|uniref:Tyrosine-protein phosphatase 69D n=1 Tax=Armadillidium nasatum TaxID=96803 RepID=A0A5N5SKS8_9CRUS|nr:Tyrosine-protein phosphatase 69D [Armadillidium nasatum]
MEHAQFGNTEQTVPKLKENYNKHMQHSGEDHSELEKEFERLGKVIEDRKAFTVANNEVNKKKNRYDFVLPYDTNCVILTPLATQIGSTYINASFVALGSGENHCAKYWPDEEEVHEYVTVKYVASESYPKYNTRSFVVTNNKNGDSVTVTQFQYVGWSGHMGEVPLVTYGIMEVITRVQSHCDANLANLSNLSSQPPTIVHCSCVDIFQTARKIRSQRQFQLQESAQYEFVYKALVEYVDMKRGENL